jgi:hypothetical protein
MTHSGEKLLSTSKLASRGNAWDSAHGFAAEQPALPGQNSIPAAERGITTAGAEPTDSDLLPVSDSYAALMADFHSHHEANAARRGGPYEHYRMVYRYGYDLGTDPRFRSANWPTVEQAARPRWEERNPGTWDEFKETIQYAWNKARGRH